MLLAYRLHIFFQSRLRSNFRFQDNCIKSNKYCLKKFYNALRVSFIIIMKGFQICRELSVRDQKNPIIEIKNNLLRLNSLARQFINTLKYIMPFLLIINQHANKLRTMLLATVELEITAISSIDVIIITEEHYLLWFLRI